LDNYDWTESRIYDYQDILRNYINLGGNILFTLYKPSLAIEENQQDSICFTEGSFIYDYCNVECVENYFGTLFRGAKAALNELDSVYVDTLKIPFMNHHIFLVEALFPTSKGEPIFLYDTKYDSSSTQGSFYNKPVGITDIGSNKKVAITSFPLYYMDTRQSVNFVEKIMHDYFSEPYLQSVDENQLNDLIDFVLAPNPVNYLLKISYTLKERKSVDIVITDLLGKRHIDFSSHKQSKGKQKFTVDVMDLQPGLYICTISTDKYSSSKKFVKLK
jgi:hypothetical protein